MSVVLRLYVTSSEAVATGIWRRIQRNEVIFFFEKLTSVQVPGVVKILSSFDILEPSEGLSAAAALGNLPTSVGNAVRSSLHHWNSV